MFPGEHGERDRASWDNAESKGWESLLCLCRVCTAQQSWEWLWECLPHTWAMDTGCFVSYSAQRRGKGVEMAKLGSVVVGEGWEGNKNQNPTELSCSPRRHKRLC